MKRVNYSLRGRFYLFTLLCGFFLVGVLGFFHLCFLRVLSKLL
jgi:hypothetical protein